VAQTVAVAANVLKYNVTVADGVLHIEFLFVSYVVVDAIRGCSHDSFHEKFLRTRLDGGRSRGKVLALRLVYGLS
jgi:hypothetical protein